MFVLKTILPTLLMTRIQDSNLPVRPPANDLVFGQLRDAHASLATDPILLKSDMFPTYHLASVVDDYEMGITHILRGEVQLQIQNVPNSAYTALFSDRNGYNRTLCTSTFTHVSNFPHPNLHTSRSCSIRMVQKCQNETEMYRSLITS